MNGLSRWGPLLVAFALAMVGALVAFRLIDQRNQERVHSLEHPAPTLTPSSADGISPIPTATATAAATSITEATVTVSAIDSLSMATPRPSPSATSTSVFNSSATPVPEVTLPSRVVLEPFKHEWQTWNNCGPAALAIGLSHFGIEDSQADIGAQLHPHAADKNVSMSELLGYAESVGIHSREMINGDLDTVRRLISIGVPVLAEGLLHLDDDVGHYRIVRGYDLSSDEVLTSDSYIGAEVWLTSADFMTLWTPFFNTYAPLYRPQDQAAVAKAVGMTWEREAMLEKAIADARSATVGNPANALLWYNLGDALFLGAQLDSARDAFEQSLQLGLPDRFFWYRFNYLSLLNSQGEHLRLLELTEPLVAEVESLVEVQIERGVAFAALEDNHSATQAFEKALEYAPSREDIRTIIDELKDW